MTENNVDPCCSVTGSFHSTIEADTQKDDWSEGNNNDNNEFHNL